MLNIPPTHTTLHIHTSYKICIIVADLTHAHNIASDLTSDSIVVADFIADLSFTDSTPMNLEL